MIAFKEFAWGVTGLLFLIVAAPFYFTWQFTTWVFNGIRMLGRDFEQTMRKDFTDAS